MYLQQQVPLLLPLQVQALLARALADIPQIAQDYSKEHCVPQQ
jgi:hypothetical protein